LQQKLNNPCEREEKWGMSFNADKSKVMHMGKTIQRTNTTEEEKYVGINIKLSLKPGAHCKGLQTKPWLS
jgi:hypothetical protein